MRQKICCFILLAAASSSVLAAPEDNLGKPEIIIRQMEDKVIHEYQINGYTYAIKVVPEKGKPYYLVAEEDGQNFMRFDEPRMLIPRWTIFSWE